MNSIYARPCDRIRIAFINQGDEQQPNAIETTYTDKAAIRSEFMKLAPKLHLVSAPSLVSKDTSVPKARLLFPRTAERFTTGLAVKPTLELIPA